MKTRIEYHKPKEKNYRVRYTNGYRAIDPTHSIWFWISLPLGVGIGIGILIGVYCV